MDLIKASWSHEISAGNLGWKSACVCVRYLSILWLKTNDIPGIYQVNSISTGSRCPPGPQDLPRDYRDGPDGAAGGLKLEYTAASGRHDHATTGAGRRVSPTTGTRSQTTCYVRRGTGRVVHCAIIERFFLTMGQLIAAWNQRLNPLNDNSSKVTLLSNRQ